MDLGNRIYGRVMHNYQVFHPLFHSRQVRVNTAYCITGSDTTRMLGLI